jgi:hypothetical protein
LSIGPQTGVRQADRDAGPGDGLKSAEGEELVRLRRDEAALPLALGVSIRIKEI